jgi:hypothetical protein
MNKFILFVCILFYEVSYAQINGVYMGPDGVPQNYQFFDGTGNPIVINDHSNIDGSPLLQEKWVSGIIKLKNGLTFSDSAINFSLFDDKLFFKRKDETFPINYPVKEFLIKYSENPNENKIYHFQNSFPAINKKDSLTFYEILFEGNSIRLLKWAHKKVRSVYKYNEPFHREYFPLQEFFAFFPKENKIVELGAKVNLKLLRKNLPEYSKQINMYHSVHKLNTQNENDLIGLFSFLDSNL